MISRKKKLTIKKSSSDYNGNRSTVSRRLAKIFNRKP